MRQCRDLLDAASSGDAPRWQFAIIDDRIRVYEGRPQRYGTQLRDGPRLEPIRSRTNARQLHAHAGRPAALAQPWPGARAAAIADRRQDAAELEFRGTWAGSAEVGDSVPIARDAAESIGLRGATGRASMVAVHALGLAARKRSTMNAANNPKLP